MLTKLNLKKNLKQLYKWFVFCIPILLLFFFTYTKIGSCFKVQFIGFSHLQDSSITLRELCYVVPLRSNCSLNPKPWQSLICSPSLVLAFPESHLSGLYSATSKWVKCSSPLFLLSPSDISLIHLGISPFPPQAIVMNLSIKVSCLFWLRDGHMT